jgi:hypothetical protein
MGWYLRLFEGAGNVKYAGESSVSYTAVPVISRCHERIYAFNPDARLIYIMRDPIERTISHYWHNVAGGWEDRDMLTAVKRLKEYISRSNYALQLRPYFDTFGRDRVYLFTLEDLVARPCETLRRLFAWLGVDPDYPVQTDEKFNVGKGVLRQTRRGLLFLDAFMEGWRWNQIKNYLPGSLPKLLERGVYRTVRREDADLRPAVRFLRPMLQEYTQALASMVGREFPEWTTLYEPLDAPQPSRAPTGRTPAAAAALGS